MQRQPNLFARDHTILGVCEGIGEDFGFNPVFLRLALTVPLFLNWQATLIGYLAAGVLVLVSRLIVPNPRVKARAEAAPQPVELRKAEVAPARQPAPVAEPLALAA